MAEESDDLAVLLQETVAELKASRKQAEVLVQQNKELVERNSDLTNKVEEILDSSRTKKQSKSKIEVSIHTKVNDN